MREGCRGGCRTIQEGRGSSRERWRFRRVCENYSVEDWTRKVTTDSKTRSSCIFARFASSSRTPFNNSCVVPSPPRTAIVACFFACMISRPIRPASPTPCVRCIVYAVEVRSKSGSRIWVMNASIRELSGPAFVLMMMSIRVDGLVVAGWMRSRNGFGCCEIQSGETTRMNVLTVGSAAGSSDLIKQMTSSSVCAVSPFARITAISRNDTARARSLRPCASPAAGGPFSSRIPSS